MPRLQRDSFDASKKDMVAKAAQAGGPPMHILTNVATVSHATNSFRELTSDELGVVAGGTGPGKGNKEKSRREKELWEKVMDTAAKLCFEQGEKIGCAVLKGHFPD
jgi:hypothetical protein